MAGTALAGAKMIAAVLGVPPWTALTPTGGWTNTGAGNVTFQTRKWGLLNEVEIIGTLTAGTLTDGTAIGGVTFAPATTQFIQVMVTTSTGAAGVLSARLAITTGGSVQIFSIPASTTVISFHGWYSLDA